MLCSTSTPPARTPSMYTHTLLGSTKLSGPRARSQLERMAATASYTVTKSPSSICSRVITERSSRRPSLGVDLHPSASATTARAASPPSRPRTGRAASNDRIVHLAGCVIGVDARSRAREPPRRPTPVDPRYRGDLPPAARARLEVRSTARRRRSHRPGHLVPRVLREGRTAPFRAVDLGLRDRPEQMVRLHGRHRRGIVRLDAGEEDGRTLTRQRIPAELLGGQLALALVEEEVERARRERGQLGGAHRIDLTRLRRSRSENVDVVDRIGRPPGADVRLGAQEVHVGEPPEPAVAVTREGVRIDARLILPLEDRREENAGVLALAVLAPLTGLYRRGGAREKDRRIPVRLPPELLERALVSAVLRAIVQPQQVQRRSQSPEGTPVVARAGERRHGVAAHVVPHRVIEMEAVAERIDGAVADELHGEDQLRVGLLGRRVIARAETDVRAAEQRAVARVQPVRVGGRSEEHTSELQSR